MKTKHVTFSAVGEDLENGEWSEYLVVTDMCLTVNVLLLCFNDNYLPFLKKES
jgi:hypothetical protein